ncbi:unnamed protein product [Symbiodinium sp. CCMP2592]|nr:unnamed protein product [Symbiodinium sp. CCMP2592]
MASRKRPLPEDTKQEQEDFNMCSESTGDGLSRLSQLSTYDMYWQCTAYRACSTLTDKLLGRCRNTPPMEFLLSLTEFDGSWFHCNQRLKVHLQNFIALMGLLAMALSADDEGASADLSSPSSSQRSVPSREAEEAPFPSMENLAQPQVPQVDMQASASAFITEPELSSWEDGTTDGASQEEGLETGSLHASFSASESQDLHEDLQNRLLDRLSFGTGVEVPEIGAGRRPKVRSQPRRAYRITPGCSVEGTTGQMMPELSLPEWPPANLTSSSSASASSSSEGPTDPHMAQLATYLEDLLEEDEQDEAEQDEA